MLIIAEHLSMELSLHLFVNLGLSMLRFEHSTFLICEATALTNSNPSAAYGFQVCSIDDLFLKI